MTAQTSLRKSVDVFLSTFVMNNFPANFTNAGQLKFRPEIERFVLYGGL